MMEIVGLKNIVPDDINKLIAKFVVVKMHPRAEILKKRIEHHLRTARNPQYTATDALHFIIFIKKKIMLFIGFGPRTTD
jgi:DNA-binding transcriptional regulator YbjK